MSESPEAPARTPARADRAAVLRARRRRRRIVIGTGWALAAGAFALTLLLLLPGTWPEAPFPQQRVLVVVTIVGAAFGLVIGSWKTIGLALLLLPVGASISGGGFWTGVFALLVAGPYAIAGVLLGVGVTRGTRALLRRRRPADGRRPRTSTTTEAPTPAH